MCVQPKSSFKNKTTTKKKTIKKHSNTDYVICVPPIDSSTRSEYSPRTDFVLFLAWSICLSPSITCHVLVVVVVIIANCSSFRLCISGLVQTESHIESLFCRRFLCSISRHCFRRFTNERNDSRAEKKAHKQQQPSTMLYGCVCRSRHSQCMLYSFNCSIELDSRCCIFFHTHIQTILSHGFAHICVTVYIVLALDAQHSPELVYAQIALVTGCYSHCMVVYTVVERVLCILFPFSWEFFVILKSKRISFRLVIYIFEVVKIVCNFHA